MGYLTSGLSFSALRYANVTRLAKFENAKGEPAHKEADGSDWSISDWLVAVTGELGELCNVWKKVRRRDFDLNDEIEVKSRRIRVINWMAEEMADIVIYLDLVAYRLNIDLGAAVMQKWNAKCRELGIPMRLDADDWHYTEDQS